MAKKVLNRAERLRRLLKTGWCTSFEIIHSVGTVTPSKVVSELRRYCSVERRRNGRLYEYRVAR